MEPVVSIRDLTYRYRGQSKPALDGVSLEVAEGEFVVVMGHSGAGSIASFMLGGREQVEAAEGTIATEGEESRASTSFMRMLYHRT